MGGSTLGTDNEADAAGTGGDGNFFGCIVWRYYGSIGEPNGTNDGAGGLVHPTGADGNNDGESERNQQCIATSARELT